MGLDYEYGINTGNRFLDFVDHDEDPEEFVAKQSQPEDKSKKSTKDSKTATSATTRKPSAKATTTTTTTATGSATSATANAARTNKENFTGKPTTNVQRGPQSNVLSDNVNQQTRVDSGRGGSRGFSRRGTGQDRPAYEGSGRGSGPYRSQRFQRFEGQHGSQEGRSFEQTGEAGEGGNNNQRFGGYQGRGGRGGDRGRGPRGTFYNRNFEGGRGRGRGGRGYFNNRNADDSSQQQQQQQPQTQDISQWQPNTDSTFENTSAEPAKTSGEALDADQPAQDRSLEPDGARRGGRGHFRARTFRNNRNFDQDRQYSHDQEGGQEDYRRNRRQHDRQPRSYTSGVKPVEKKDGEGAHNWGNAAEIPDEEQTAAAEDSNEAADQAASAPKNWADQVDEAEKKQLTLDEYKKQIEEKKRTQQEKFPQFNPRAAGEGEDPKNWQFKHEYRKKNDHEESGEEGEEGSGAEEEEDEDEDEHVSGKKRVITIPLHFNPTELPRGGSFGPRGGPRRGGRYRDRPFRDDQQRSKSPNQQQSPTSQPTDENRFDDQQQKPYRGGARQGPGRADYRRSYGNSARGSRGGYNRSHANPNTPDFDNTLDFPTLPKQ